MLVLSRKSEQDVRFPNLGITVSVESIRGQRVRLGIEAPPEIEILRGELDKGRVGRDSATGLDQSPAKSAASDDPAKREADRRERHDYKNQVNAAMLGLHLARRQIAAGRLADADQALDASLRRLTVLERLAGQTRRSVSHAQAEDEQRAADRWHGGEQVSSGESADSGESAGSAELAGSEDGSATEGQSTGQPSVDVLLVEDDVNERSLLRGLLELEGYRVRVAGNGNEALRCLQGFTPRFVLLDMCMPGAGGDVAVDGIRRQARLRHLPVFAVSASSPESVGLSICPESVNGWFPKPLDAAQMLDELRVVTASLSA